MQVFKMEKNVMFPVYSIFFMRGGLTSPLKGLVGLNVLLFEQIISYN